LATPLVRVGPKGEGRFRPASWDEALALVAARLGAVIAADGGAAVTNVHYTGTCGLLQYSFPLRLVRRIGATEVEPDTVCNLAGHAALDLLWGSSTTGFDPRTARDTRCVLVWGANPSATAPHADEHWLPEAAGPVVVVDPIRTPTAARADLHLQPFPGSDAALAFALAHVLRRDGLLDEAFLAARTLGWEELEPHVAAFTVADGERATGVPAALIEAAAHLYGAGPSLLWIGQGLQRQPRGGNVVRAVSMLPALTGNVGKPGAGWLYLNGRGSRGIDDDYLEATHLAPDPPTIGHMELADHLADPARARALLVWNTNPAASNPDQRRLREALGREDLFTVVVDLFQTDTADFADVVLPAASFLECDDLVASYFDLSLSAQVTAVEPPGEALPNTEVFRRLAGALGYEQPELHEPDRAVIDTLLARAAVDVGWEQLCARGTVWVAEEPVLQLADGRVPTPSGRVELASDEAERLGQPRTPLPLADPRPAAGRLRLLSPASPWAMNTTFANEPKLRRKLGPPTVRLHPADALDRGLAAGALVRVESETGALTAEVALDEDLQPGVASMPKGRWPRFDEERANVNALVASETSDLGRSTCVHATEVSVVAVRAGD
ncbi:MAG: molybdopterin-dependent oxidoreductase, partial [Thermoleophilia bacterium]